MATSNDHESDGTFPAKPVELLAKESQLVPAALNAQPSSTASERGSEASEPSSFPHLHHSPASVSTSTLPALPGDSNRQGLPPIATFDIGGAVSPLVPSTGPSSEEVASMQRQLDQDMEKLLSSGSSAAHNTCTLSDDDKRAAINYFDQVEKASKSKAVEVGEILDVFKQIGLDLSPEQFEEYVTAMLRLADKSTRGQRMVSRTEFAALYHSVMQSEDLKRQYLAKLQKEVKHLHEEEIVAKAKEVFSKYDKNKDSQVSVHELLPIMKDNLDLPELSEQQWQVFVSDALKRGDKNNDGNLDFKEFLNFYRKCLADPHMKAKYQQKIVMRFREGSWQLDK
eukprot:CAMPEP_0114247646 /NCGR_PEP_ID=MMETSP0058-20121206/13135_1 /TAXON_ID=36894 /ORGANISM="Pyramimonas parkeae, CCMP726" /LENGTH=338 /DNA_ID=CAMNT_0001360969 /DNA_START=352 /DNA_END=1368 /DNA_ORIENTATION=-